MTPLVLDASIAADWLLDDELDPRAADALTGLRRDGAIVPPLWHYEIRNALLTAERRGRVSPSQTTERLGYLQALPIRTDDATNLQAAFTLAREHRLSFYDALYLELAKRLGSGLATLDAALARAALAEGLNISPA